MVATEEGRGNHVRTTSGMDRPVTDVTAGYNDISRWATITAEVLVRVPRRRPGVVGISKLVIFEATTFPTHAMEFQVVNRIINSPYSPGVNCNKTCAKPGVADVNKKNK